jgi:hypothetical protein
MKDRQELVGPSSEADVGVAAQGSASGFDADRAFLLECRLEQLRSSLHEARAEADRARTRLAEAAAREADHARRQSFLHEELAAAREEVAALHGRLEHSEALRAELEGQLFESGAGDDAGELIRLRHEVQTERQRAVVNERAVAHLRARVDELVATRETLLTRVAEWQRVVRQGDPDAVDLAEFIAALRGDILELEHRSVVGERREAELREQLGRASANAAEGSRPASTPRLRRERPESGTAVERDDVPRAAAPDPDEEGTEHHAPAPEGGRTDELAAALAAADSPEIQIALLLRLGRSGDDAAFYAIRRWASATEPRVRAAAYEALGRLLEHDPARLEPHVRSGLADSDPRVRRRVILAAASARGLALRPHLEPLRGDPDPKVRRLVHEVLRGASTAASGPDEGASSPGLASVRVTSGAAS